MSSPVLSLADAPAGAVFQVHAIESPAFAPEWCQWLDEIGFFPGETVSVLTRGVLGGDPMVVRIGQSTFALRRAEAACIQVSPRAAHKVWLAEAA